MPILSRAKTKVGHVLNSAAMKADAPQTDFYVYLSEIVLGGLVLKCAFWAVVGRSDCRLDHGSNHYKTRIRWNEGKKLLRVAIPISAAYFVALRATEQVVKGT